MTQTADHGETEHMNAPLVAAGGVITTSSGDAIAIMHQYAHLAQGKTIHSCGQMEHNGLHVRQIRYRRRQTTHSNPEWSSHAIAHKRWPTIYGNPSLYRH